MRIRFGFRSILKAILLVMFTFVLCNIFVFNHGTGDHVWVQRADDPLLHYDDVEGRVPYTQSPVPAFNDDSYYETEQEEPRVESVDVLDNIEYVQPRLSPEFWKQDNSWPSHFKFVRNEPGMCSGPQFGILIMILSAPDHLSQREEIRMTWGKNERHHGYTLKSIFLLGKTKEASLQEAIREESRKHHDIIQANFTDSYHNLTYKTLSGLTWVRKFCPQAALIYKVDDDAGSVSRTRVIKYLKTRKADRAPLKREIVCLFAAFENPSPKRDPQSRWYVPREMYPDSFYPSVCLGSGGYVLTMDVVQDIIDTSHRTKFFWLEDVYITGILRTLAGNISISAVPKRTAHLQLM